MNVGERVAKLLALAGNNSSEEEAKAALLKARELMAKHKLRPEDCKESEKQKVVQSLIGVSVTARKCAWGVDLSAIIARHYCCIAYREHCGGSQTQNIGFVGLEDDFKICTDVFRYAFEFAKRRSEEIFQKDAGLYSARERRQNAEAYGAGFCDGLQDAFQEQQEQHQEWGLVMVVPQVVRNTEIGQKKPKFYGKSMRERLHAANADAMKSGYRDGHSFDPAKSLTEAKKQTALGH